MSIFDSLFGGGGGPDPMSPEQIKELLAYGADQNRVDQVTPFGSMTWSNNADPVQSWDDWSAANPLTRGPSITRAIGDGNERTQRGRITGGTRADYDKYASNYNTNNSDWQANINLSDDMQGIWDRVFSEGSYDNYADDYMGEYNRLTEGVYDRQDDRFQQSMFDRGLPEGGDLYGDLFSQHTKRQDDATQGAAFGARQAGDAAQARDYNRLASAMGLSQINVPQSDPNAAANMAMNANTQAMQQHQNSQNGIWNTVAGLGGAYMMSGMPMPWGGGGSGYDEWWA